MSGGKNIPKCWLFQLFANWKAFAKYLISLIRAEQNFYYNICIYDSSFSASVNFPHIFVIQFFSCLILYTYSYVNIFNIYLGFHMVDLKWKLHFIHNILTDKKMYKYFHYEMFVYKHFCAFFVVFSYFINIKICK